MVSLHGRASVTIEAEQLRAAIEARSRADMTGRYQRTERRILDAVETILTAAKRAARDGKHEAAGALVDQVLKLWDGVADARALREALAKARQDV